MSLAASTKLPYVGERGGNQRTFRVGGPPDLSDKELAFEFHLFFVLTNMPA